MHKKILMALTGMVLSSELAMAYNFDLVENEVGDSRLVTLGGYLFAKPIVIELLPVAEGEEDCAVLCQIIYKDAQFDHPDENSWKRVQYTDGILNEWLRQYVQNECAGADLETLCASYASCRFARTLQDDFSKYVTAKIEEMPPEQRISVDAVTVLVQANDAFKEEIRRRTPLQP